MKNESVLVVDDDPSVRRLLEDLLSSHAFRVVAAPDGPRALQFAEAEAFAVAVVDLSMPGLSGMETVRGLKKLQPDLEIVIFTGEPSIETSIDAVREHVFDYVPKPSSLPEMLKRVRMAAEHRALRIENRNLLAQIQRERNGLAREISAAKRAIERSLARSPAFIGVSAAAASIRRHVAAVATAGVNVLLLGESGTGKDVVARLLHEASGRDPERFVKVNCPAITEPLLESELFGHEAGAFTGALQRKPGRFELASGGTLFLDEIGDLPLALQAKLLQAVEQKQFYRVGGKKPVEVDVRVVAATNAPLAKRVEEGRFRADLFYRLAEYTISLPPLRRRREDIPPLVNHFLEAFREMFNSPEREIPPETMASLCACDWPGNVRELQSVVRRFVVTGRHDALHGAGLLAGPSDGDAPAEFLLPPAAPDPENSNGEGARILDALLKTQWNRRKAAEHLGISYSTLRRRIAQYDLNQS